eukprot:4271824-Alexandrium_andersonii.AAC.1
MGQDTKIQAGRVRTILVESAAVVTRIWPPDATAQAMYSPGCTTPFHVPCRPSIRRGWSCKSAKPGSSSRTSVRCMVGGSAPGVPPCSGVHEATRTLPVPIPACVSSYCMSGR